MGVYIFSTFIVTYSRKLRELSILFLSTVTLSFYSIKSREVLCNEVEIQTSERFDITMEQVKIQVFWDVTLLTGKHQLSIDRAQHPRRLKFSLTNTYFYSCSYFLHWPLHKNYYQFSLVSFLFQFFFVSYLSV